MDQTQVNEYFWRICENFKNKTEIKKNYLVYLSALLYIKYRDCFEDTFGKLYHIRDNYYIAEVIDREIKNMRAEEEDKNLFSNIQFTKISFFRDIGENSVLAETIEAIYLLTQKIEDRKQMANAFEYALNQAYYKDDMIQENSGFFTPLQVTKLMTDMIVEQPKSCVYDPIAGSGNFLKSAMDKMAVEVYGKEDNLNDYNICKTTLLLNEEGDKKGVIYTENTKDVFNIKADYILSNPPFSDRNWKNRLEVSKNRYVFHEYGVLDATVGDYAYVVSMLQNLKENGKMAIILPHGVLFRENEKQIRRKLLEHHNIEAIIGLPENLFYATRVAVIIMILSKNRKDDRVFFIDASEEYDTDKRNNILSENCQEKIVKTYREKSEIENYSHLATREEIEKNDFNLSIQKYVHKQQDKTKVEKSELIQEVTKVEKERVLLEKNIQDVLEVLGYGDVVGFYEERKRKTNYQIDYEKIGRYIRVQRRKKNLTLEKVACETEIASSHFCQIERGDCKMSLEVLVRICNVLEIEIGELFQ